MTEAPKVTPEHVSKFLLYLFKESEKADERAQMEAMIYGETQIKAVTRAEVLAELARELASIVGIKPESTEGGG